MPRLYLNLCCYLDLLDSDKGYAENIDHLFFAKDATMKQEYGRLYSSLFANPKQYKDVVNLLAKNKRGLTRGEIAEKLKTANNGHLTKTLRTFQHRATYQEGVRDLRQKHPVICALLLIVRG